MTEETLKCVKGESCIHCGSTYCRFVDEVNELEQENKELKEEIQFHNKENSNLLAERNALQIGYDEIREVRERYRSALEEIREIVTSAFAKQRPYKEDFAEIETKIDEVLNG